MRGHKKALLTSVVLCSFGCGRDTGIALERAANWLKQAQQGTSVDPCDDQFTFMDGGWLVVCPVEDGQSGSALHAACQFEYQLCKGREAYDRAFSFSTARPSTERLLDLREAAARLFRGAVFPFSRYVDESVDLDDHYIVANVGPLPTDPADLAALRELVRDDAHEYYFAHSLQALTRYVEVLEAMIELEEGRADAADRQTGTFEAKKREEFERRGSAAGVLGGPAATLSRCVVNVENESVALGLAGLKETEGDAVAAANLTGLAPIWIDEAVRHISEQSLAEVPEGLSVQPGEAAVDPILMLRSMAERKTGFWSCGRPSFGPNFVEFYSYASGAVLPTTGDTAPEAALAHYFDPTGLNPVPNQNSRVTGSCLPVQHPSTMGAIGHLRLMEQLRRFAFGVVDSPFQYDPPGPEGYVTVSNVFVDGIKELLDETLGTPRASWRVDVIGGVIQVNSSQIQTPDAQYLIYGTEALSRVVSGDDVADLESTELVSGYPQAYQAQALGGGTYTEINIPKILGDAHPLRGHCLDNPTIGGCNAMYDGNDMLFADDVFLVRQPVPTGIDDNGEVATRHGPLTIFLYHEYDECPSGEFCIASATGRAGVVVDWLSYANVKYGGWGGGHGVFQRESTVHRRGGLLEQRLYRTITRRPNQCAEFRFNSLGLDKQLVPPLENEISENNDPFENSFRTYLDRAEDAASHAAVLAGIALQKEEDLQANINLYQAEAENFEAEALGEIEEICGVGGVQETGGDGGIGCETFKANTAVGSIGTNGGGALLPEADTFLDLSELPPVGREAFCEGALGAPITGVPTPPTIESFATALDDNRVAAQCAAFSVVHTIRQIEIPDLPVEFADGQLSLEEQARFGGRYLQVLIEIDSELLNLSQAVIGIATTMQSFDARLEAAKAQVSSLVTSEEGKAADSMVLAGEAMQGWANGISALGSGNPAGVFGGLLSFASTAVLAEGRAGQLNEQYRQEEAAATAVVHGFISDMFQVVGDLEMTTKTMQISGNRIASLIEELKILEGRQRRALERAERQTAIAALTTGVGNPLTFTSLNRAGFEARRAVRRSKVLSYIARRAIEFRLVVDLSTETAGDAIVEAPANWADTVYVLEDVAADYPPPNGTGQFDPQENLFARATTQYVQRLGDFVTYYSFKYPFQGDSDTAVLSLKDDLMPIEFACNSAGNPVVANGDEAAAAACACLDLGGGEIDVRSDPGDFSENCIAAGGVVDPPYDHDGVLLREAFYVKCRDDEELVPSWKSTCAVADIEYYQIDFNLSLVGIEAGRLAREGQIASGRYNYRLDRVAANLVGSNVKDCSLNPDATSACFANAFLPFTLVHSGRVALRDHDSRPHAYAMSTARVESGKALAAERFLTTPLATADATLIEQFANYELRGRPLQGVYSLRLINGPSLAFTELEDVQLLVTYRSWTAFEPVD